MSAGFHLRCRGVDIDAGRPLVMGVVNATPEKRIEQRTVRSA